MNKKLLLSVFLIVSASFANWIDQNSTISTDLNDISFVDNDFGWAVGYKGNLLSTSNGGESWTPQNSNTVQNLNSIQMLSNSLGYCVGNKGSVLKYENNIWTPINPSETRDFFGVFLLTKTQDGL